MKNGLSSATTGDSVTLIVRAVPDSLSTVNTEPGGAGMPAPGAAFCEHGARNRRHDRPDRHMPTTVVPLHRALPRALPHGHATCLQLPLMANAVLSRGGRHR